MKLATFQSRMVNYYKTGKCYYLTSAPGRGKTTVIEGAPAIISAALGKRIGYSYMSGPLLTPADTVGYLIPTKDKDGNAASYFTKPFWWYTSEGLPLDAYDGGVVFVDEADKADIDIKKIIGEMALSGKCGPHRLPPGWVVWMAGNRKKDRSGSTKDLDHLINRRCEIEIDDDMQGWLDWAMQRGLNGVGLAFAEQNPQIVFSDGVPKEQGPWCTPRSLVECIEHLMQFAGPDGRLPMDATAQHEAKGFIGAAAAAQLFATIKLEHELPALADILADPEGSMLPQRPDAQMLVAYSLAARTDLTNVDPIVRYISRMPKEFEVLFASSATRRDPDIINTPTFDNWCATNASMMQLIHKR